MKVRETTGYFFLFKKDSNTNVNIQGHLKAYKNKAHPVCSIAYVESKSPTKHYIIVKRKLQSQPEGNDAI